MLICCTDVTAQAMCVYIYIYICIYMYTYKHYGMYIYIYIYTYIHTYMPISGILGSLWRLVHICHTHTPLLVVIGVVSLFKDNG